MIFKIPILIDFLDLEIPKIRIPALTGKAYMKNSAINGENIR
jgi:hypothetical protein